MLVFIPIIITIMVLNSIMNSNIISMQIRITFVILIGVVLALVPGAPVETDMEVIFHEGMNGYNTTRIPALVHHQDVFFAFCEARKDTFYDIGEMEIILRRGTRKDWNVTWGPVEVVARKSGYRMMNPVPIVDTTIDMILLVYNVHPAWLDQWDQVAGDKYQTNLMVIKSFDLGATWTAPQDITQDTLGKMKPTISLYAPGPGHGIQMKSGRLVVPGNYFVKVYNAKQKEYSNGTINQANVIYSDDHGRTWRPGGSIGYGEHCATGNAIHSNEATVVEIDDGQLCLNARTLHPDQPRVLSFSRDGGMTFSPGQLAWTLKEPGYVLEINHTMNEVPFLLEDNSSRPARAAGCQASMLGLAAPHLLSPSRKWVVFSNPASPKFRENMAVRISKDGCRIWSKPWIIYANPSGYSDLTYFETWDSDAGVHSPNIAILFEGGKEFFYKTIQFKMFSLERMLQGVGLSSKFNVIDKGIEVPPDNPYDLDRCQSCAVNSTYQEYSNGYCCVCNPGNYGNGRTCIRTDRAQRMNGEVSGTINNLRISSANLHVYVNTNEGLVYTAISPLPDRIGYSLQSLSPIGELIGWMFAVPSGKGINGFTQTGGLFTSSMNFNFETGQQLSVEHEFLGVDADGYIRSHMTVDGEVPDIPAGIKLGIDDYKEVFLRRRNGLIHSFGDRTLKYKDGSEQEIRYTLDHTIQFTECTGDDADQDPRLNSMRVTFASIYLVYEPNESILRFRQQSKVVLEDEPLPDPCQNNNCDQNAQCLPQGTLFRCKCNNGFEGNGYTCRASDPCHNNNCDINAYCYPSATSFECICNDGYAWDGYTCTVIIEDPCVDNQCDTNASCYPRDTAYLCQCNSGYEGNGYYCQVLPPRDNCDQNQCHANAYCTPTETSYECHCNQGYEGNGFICIQTAVDPCAANACHKDAACISQSGAYTCVCKPGYEGNGYDCRLEVDPCTNNECDENAYCTPVRAGYQCTCNQFYQGDGYTCLRETVNRCDNCDGNAQCIPLANGFRCVCNPGYQGNGRSCQDIDECTQGGTAACHLNAECYNSIGSYSCYCNPGFVGDGRTCTEIVRPPTSDAFLMFAQDMNLMRLPLDPNQKGGKMIMRMRQTIVGVSYDCQDGYAYWTDVSSRSINRAKYDGSDYQTLVYTGLSSPEGIAVDHLSRNMYWTDSGFDHIEVSKLDGSNRKLLFDTDLVNPRGIAVDPIGGILYWTDWDRVNPKIEKSSMDGTNREVLIDTNLGLPNSLTVDYLSQQICWADAGTKRIECMNLNGNTGTRYTVFPASEYPFGITSHNYNLYWTDWDSRNIQTINKNGGLTSESLQLPKGGNGRVYGLTAVTSCPGGSNACASGNGGCSSICLPTPGNRRTCACPTSSDGNEIPCVP